MVEMLSNTKSGFWMFLLGAKLHIQNLDFSLPQKTNWTRFSYLDNNTTFFLNCFSPQQNKKYNSVNSSISQNMMNEQSRNIYIFCRIFLRSWIIPETSHSSCVCPHYSQIERTAITFSPLAASGLGFCSHTFANKKVHRTKHTLDFSWGQLDFSHEWCCFTWHTWVP